MIREAIGVADTVEEAKEVACRELGVSDTGNIGIEVLQMPEKKVFGLFGSTQAKVRVYVEVSALEKSIEYLRDVLSCMGVTNVSIEATENENGAELTVECDDVSMIIGRRGETLDALQYLAGLVANHVDKSYYRITINTGSFREKREKTLEALGRKMAIKAARTGRKQPLEPMNPYERRIIHTAVQKVSGAISWSEGEDLARHVVIGPDPKNRPQYNKNNRGRQQGRDNRRPGGGYNNNNKRPGGYDNKKSGGYNNASRGSNNKGYNSYNNNNSNYQSRVPKNEGAGASLYGKIELNKNDDSE